MKDKIIEKLLKNDDVIYTILDNYMCIDNIVTKEEQTLKQLYDKYKQRNRLLTKHLNVIKNILYNYPEHVYKHIKKEHKLNIILENDIKIPFINNMLKEHIISILTINNPKYIENKRMGRYNGKTSKILKFYKKHKKGLILPRGFMSELIELSFYYYNTYTIDDRRLLSDNININFNGKLKSYQEKAVNTVLKKDFGVLNAPTGSGKTVMALYMIAKRKQRALIIVHTKELLYQWVDRAESFLNIKKEEIGIIGDGKCSIGKVLTVALIQTLYKKLETVKDYIGFLIIDEVHRCPSRLFIEAVTAFSSNYMLGLSATPYRKDGLTKLIFWHVGSLQHKIEQKELADTNNLMPIVPIIRNTEFTTELDIVDEYTKVLSEIVDDEKRNEMILNDIQHEYENSKNVLLIISDRKNHCLYLQNQLSILYNIKVDLLIGGIKKKDRDNVVKKLNNNETRIVIATGQLIGEGFDCPALSCLFMTTPIQYRGRVTQYIGRVLRTYKGKEKATIYDYVDHKISVFVRSSGMRKKVYESINNNIKEK